SRARVPLPRLILRDLVDVAIPFLKEGRADVFADVVLQSGDDEIRREGAMLRVQVQQVKVSTGNSLKFIEVARNLPVRLRDLAQDIPQGLHLLSELPHVVLEVGFAHARSPSKPRSLKSPHFPSGLGACEVLHL